MTTPDDDEPRSANRPETRAYLRLVALLVSPTFVILVVALPVQAANGS